MISGLFSNPILSEDTLIRVLTYTFFAVPVYFMQIAQNRSKNQFVFLKQRRIIRYTGLMAATSMLIYIYLFAAEVKGGENFIYFQF
jgi:hypothetical protein